MNAIILSIGDELVLGQTVDTNSAWLSQQLAAVGCDVTGHITVADNQSAIERAIGTASYHCSLLIISGGLGPTEDDLTRQALAAKLDQPLELNQQWLDHLEVFFQRLGRKMPETNKIQAMIPRGTELIWNHNGTAAGIHATMEHFMEVQKRPGGAAEIVSLISPQSCAVFVVPGVPKEMQSMFTRDVLPRIKLHTGKAVILSRTLHTFGAGESTIAEKLGDLMNRTRNPSVGTTVASGLVSLRINARFPTKEKAEQELEQTTQACRSALGDLIFGQDDQTLPQVVADLLRSPHSAFCILHSALPTVSTAESCTGGLLAKLLTDIPGSSSYFTQGWITYSNQAKYERLGVSMEVINLNGAVSEPVVEAMARNARRLSKSTFALSISGIAGPTGGSTTKPVGTVCIALAHPPVLSPLPPGEGQSEGRRTDSPRLRDDPSNSQVQARTFHFPGDREAVRDRAAKMALTMLRYHLLGKPMP